MDRRSVWVLCVLGVACSPVEVSKPSGDLAKQTREAPAEAQGAKAAAPVADVLEILNRDERLRYSFSDMAHFGVHDQGGSFRVDLGEGSALKHIQGGWRSGWSPTTRREGAVSYLEANASVARVFFRHEAGGFDRIALKVRSVKHKNRVAASLNGVEIGEIEIGEEWSSHTLSAPEGASRAGENHLALKIAGSLRAEGRAQFAHIDAIEVLAPGREAPQAASSRAQVVALGGRSRAALVASAPGRWRFLVQLPEGAATLGLAYGGEGVGGEVAVRVGSDRAAAREVFAAKVERADGWSQAVVPLSGFEGQVVEVSLEARGEVAEGRRVALSGGIWAPAPKDEAVEASAPKVEAKNAMVYLIDTLRYDKLGVYNPDSSVKTPNFDRFARDGVLFEAAYDAENWTKPSTATILTGLYPWSHKTKEAESKLPASVVLIGEHLQRQKLRTLGLMANGYVSQTFGFGRGWHKYTNYIREGKVTDAGNLVDDALGWIDAQKGARFFAYIHTIDPHVPYSAPGPWKFKQWNALGRGKYGGRLRAQDTGNQIADIKSGKFKPTEEDRVFFESLYDSEVAYNDQEFGRLIDGLKARGIYDSTIIIILVDHGEEFWDHGSVGHGHSLYDEMVHSPLLVRHPGLAPRGRRLSQVVSTAQVVPSVLEALGVEPIEGLDAGSFMDTFDGVGAPHPRVAVSDFMFRRKSIRAGRFHWITDGVEGPLFDVIDDRRELKDLRGSHPIGQAFARSHFGMFMGAPDQARWWSEAAGPTRRSGAVEEIADVDEELKKQLEAMGYIDGATGDRSPQEDRKLMEQEDSAPAP